MDDYTLLVQQRGRHNSNSINFWCVENSVASLEVPSSNFLVDFEAHLADTKLDGIQKGSYQILGFSKFVVLLLWLKLIVSLMASMNF
ncbi:hypothetical protein NPIL_458571 [Nephila pilipes]|uniref:Uncharacterized protein n=1 Tax=Nephila pilipes TaxID=299642 RepID=A0A8X6NN91_NEPPI|nr:hypothetical protein NPIL_458571 [Nephila pilipes]